MRTQRQRSPSPLLALALGLFLTLVVWTLVEYDRTRTEAQRAVDGADRIARELDRSLRLLEQSLRMTAAGVLWRTSLDDGHWADFADRLQLPGVTPGAVTGLGFAPRIRADAARAPDVPERPRHPLRFVRQWDRAAPLPAVGIDLTADSSGVPDLWRVRRNLGPVYSVAWNGAGAGREEAAPTVWMFLAVENDGYAKGGTRGVLVASLRLDALLAAALSTASDLQAELTVPGESGTRVRVRADPSSGPPAAMLERRELARPGGEWSLAVGLRDPTPMLGGNGVILVVGAIASCVAFGVAVRTREVRRRADRFEDRAARNESRFELLAESAPFLVWMTDDAFSVTYLNPVWRQLTGSERAEGLGTSWRNAIHADDHPVVQAALAGAGGAGTFRCRILHRDGSHRWLLVNYRRTIGEDAASGGFMGVGIDIDSVHRAEELRAADHEFLRVLLDSVPAPISVKSEDLRYLLVNDALCRQLGRTREEIVGRNDFDLYAPEDAVAIQARDLQVLATGTALDFEAQYRFPGGRTIDVTGAKTVIRRGDGAALVLTTITDVTALRTQERELVGAGLRLRITGEILRAALDARAAAVVVDIALRGLVQLLGDVRATFWVPEAQDVARVAQSVGTASIAALAPIVGDPVVLERYRDLLSDLPCVVVRDIAAADERAGMHGATAGALIAMPVRVRGVLQGIIEVEAEAPRPWTSVDVGAVMDLGNALAAHGEFAAAREERDAAHLDVGAQRAFLDAILDSIPHPVFVKDRAHRLVTVNRAVADAWALPKSEILGRRDEDLIPQAAAIEAYAEDDRVFAEGVALTRETQFRTRAGLGEWALLIKQPVQAGAGSEYIVGVAIPVGDLKAAQQRAEESERLLSAVLNAIPTPVVAKDDALRWVLVNDAYLATIGRTREEALGLTDADLLPSEEAARFAEQDRHVLETGQPQRGEEAYLRSDGALAWRIKTKQVVRLVDGRSLVVAAGIDITDRKRVENEALAVGKRLEVMNELAAATIAGTAFADIAALAVDGLVRLVAGSGAVYAMLDIDGNVTALRHAGFGDDARPGAEAFRLEAAPGLAAILANGRVAVTRDVDTLPALLPLAASRRGVGMRSSVEVPVLRRGRLRGVAALCSATARDWSDEEISILHAVAAALALALEAGEARAERVSAERGLREAKDFVEGLIDAVPQAIFVKDEAGRWVMANQAFQRMSGHARDALIGRTNREVHPDAWERMDREDAEAFASALPLQYETPVQDGAGTTTWWLTSKSAVQLSAGTRYLVCSAADVSALKRASVEVERSRQFLDAILNALPVPVFVKSADHRWVIVNEAGERLYGKPRSELVGRTDHDLHDRAFSDAVWQEDDLVLAGRGPIVHELFMPIRDGSPRWILETKVATALADGSRFVIAASLDITGRKQAEEEVLASRARLEVLNGIAGRMVRGAPLDETVAFAVRSLSDALAGANVACWRRAGGRMVLAESSDAALAGRDIDLDACPACVARLEAGETVVVDDAEAALDAGLDHMAAHLAAPGMRAFVVVPIGAGTASGLQALLSVSAPTPRAWTAHERRTVQEAAESLVLAHIGDSTERARAKVEAELRENEAVLQAIAWASDLGLWTWDVAGNHYHFSDRAKAQLGYAPHEFDESAAWSEHILEEDRPRFVAALRASLKSDSNRYEIEYRLRHRDGSYRDMLVRAQIQRDAAGRAVRFVGANIDVTDFRRAQADLIRHRDDLERVVADRTAELVTAKDAAEAANEAKSDFLANMSHELRTPMHAILSFSRLGIDRTADAEVQLPKIRQYLDRIHQSGGRLLTLLNDLLDLSKLEAGKMRYEFARCDLVDVVNGIVAEMNAYARENGVRIDVRHQGPVFAWCDPVRVGQVVRNLLSNAVKFTPAGTAVRIVLDDDGNVARIAVLDEGVGVPEDELEAVFDKFVQSSKTNSGAGGTGLGLAICREIARQHRGTIQARNNPAGGACFTLTLPVFAEADASRVAAA
jgi:PAS domain S-box-containing protein